jgi:hypothetical protein
MVGSSHDKRLLGGIWEGAVNIGNMLWVGRPENRDSFPCSGRASSLILGPLSCQGCRADHCVVIQSRIKNVRICAPHFQRAPRRDDSVGIGRTFHHKRPFWSGRCRLLQNSPFYPFIHPSVHVSTALFWALVTFSISLSSTQTIGPLERSIGPSQGRYLHTAQHKHRINAHRHPCLEWDSIPRYQRLSGLRQFMP